MPENIENNFPFFESVSDDLVHPLWSVMIPTFNCANYLRFTLESVLSNDPGSEYMQIEVVDDRSTKDDPEQVVNEIGKGRISFFRQPKNVGATSNFNTCIQRANGKWVHILHGDDYVLRGYYQMMFEGLKLNNVGAAFCRGYKVNENNDQIAVQKGLQSNKGVLENWITQIGERNLIYSPSIIVKRSTYEKIGGYDLTLIHSADWEMWRRISTSFDFWYNPEPSICYREHSKSDTSKLIRSGENLADIRVSIYLAGKYLDPKITKKALRNCSIKGLQTAQHFAEIGDFLASANQIIEALKSHFDLSSIIFIMRYIIYAAVSRIKMSLIRDNQLKRNK